ncbi:PREDICTED: leucine-rich repeat, immunoglobulin-like domain and transmembrane domain-containing protein 3 [Elephantulus edwardii]|uniref:leucine-rich repeat, immunoglobulin-like domain and transmembrane domain-containing protein 3 n=1 Tax=Elephantulus edwardii TaxID=28737 RepID=UPI0003F0590B|nr:PREDICTED: leucine-rich repeat, immunoglobulin-like domain and transmembrane domain-containing protein 3 [Elephantulus edwardii]
MHLFINLCVALSFIVELRGSCPSQCTCRSHGPDDGTGSRLVLCNDLDMNEVPTNLPVDTVKLHIEKTILHRIPAEAFYYLVELQCLWVTCNSVISIESSSFYNLKKLHELRLHGNSLAAFPWASLQEMPRLRTLDLHNNRITSVPTEATRYLKNLTYLDLSSNRLTTLPPDFMESWSHFSAEIASRSLDFAHRRIVLGLQDNPWFCDCHISKMIELSKVADPTVVLLDPLMVCNEPQSLAGIPFQRAELAQCQKPSVMTSATKITSALGSNVLLRCDATGYPTPELTWIRSNSAAVNYAVIQESPGEGVRWSIISLTGISYKDAGDYKCKAKNLAGMSEAVVTVTVVGVVTTTTSLETLERTGEDHPHQEVMPGSRRSVSTLNSSPSPLHFSSTSLSASTLSPPSTASFSPSNSPVGSWTTILSTKMSTSTTMVNRWPLQLHLEGKRNLKVEMDGRKLPLESASKKEELALLDQATPVETNATIENLRVVRETEESVTLMWNTVNSTYNSAVTVLYSKYGEKDLLHLNVEASKNQVTVEGLESGRQYIACVCPKGAPPQVDQCITFSTNRVGEGDFPGSFLIVVSCTACVIVMPLICYLLYKVCKLQCKTELFWEDDLAKETYIQFETLSPRSQSVAELWTQRYKDDSEKLLLCSRLSVESEMTFKSEGSKLEYYG